MWLGASLRGASADDVFDGLAPLGEPPGGWWDVVANLKASHRPRVVLTLPRPGDRRGVHIPATVDLEGAVGCSAGLHKRWLGAHTSDQWLGWDDHTGGLWHTGSPWPTVAMDAADRELRAAVVLAAHSLDDTGTNPLGQGLPSFVETIVDAWLEPAHRLPAASRRLAAAALPMLVAFHLAASAQTPVGITVHDTQRMVTALSSVEPAARTALEAAYSTATITGGGRDG